MAPSLTPRQIVKQLLNGVRPERPLLLPIVFGLGAKIENLAAELYRKNPTKIVSALRQMRAPFRADGVTCYFDQFLEVEALGAALQASPDGAAREVRWPKSIEPGQVPEGLCPPEEISQRGRVPVAIEVVRRMNALPGREFLLCCSVTGPLTLARQMTGKEAGALFHDEVPQAAKELAASVATQATTAFLEAGADVIFLHEPSLPVLSGEDQEEWISLLAPTINVIRFYEALPVLHLPDTESVVDDWDAVFRSVPDAIVCQPLEAVAKRSGSSSGTLSGLALPLKIFQPEASGRDSSSEAAKILAQSPGLVLATTESDLPASADFKLVAQTFVQLARTP
jgi:uroporphyrinogen decarboxylase-like protein